MLSHGENVRTSKFWRKSKEKKRIFFENLPREYKDLILVKKKIKIISCLCTFKGAVLGKGLYGILQIRDGIRDG
jgi:hypothetical protein